MGANTKSLRNRIKSVDSTLHLTKAMGLVASSKMRRVLDAMEKAMRIYNGKALINSVSGKEESIKAVFPLVKKYGGAVIAVTLDENGIPATAEGRVDIAKKILATASEYGIDKKDIIFAIKLYIIMCLLFC